MSLLQRLLEKPFYRFYERRLMRNAGTWNLPKHIGIILDGNRRFAKHIGLSSVIDGHARGADKLHEVLNWSFDMGIPVVSCWIFSIENFDRPEDEVTSLLALIEEKTHSLMTNEDIHRRRVKVQYHGQLHRLPESLQKTIKEVEAATADYDQCNLNVMIAYGGRHEITAAVRDLLQDQIAAGKSIEEALAELKPEALSEYLYTSGQPDPDLIIRTSGEIRLSGFLLWQSAYAEYYFCDSFWPAFRKIDFLRALRAYHQRQRRFGK